LLAGVLAGQRIAARVEGDSTLSTRPMQRVIEPLALMGAEIESNEGRPPLTISNNGGSGSRLQGIDYALPVASAQVKSAVLLAGLRARGMTRVHEPIATRDHTERMLEAAGLKLERAAGWIGVEGGQSLQPFSLDVPGDQSSAAFLFAAVALQGGRITVRRLGVNPTRTGFLRVLEQLGCSVETSNPSVEFGEPVADVTVRGEARESVEVTPEQVPELIDELPLLALVATQAKGRTSIRGAAELRVKETDRIATTARALRALGANVQEAPDGLCIEGGQNLRGNEVSSEGDHRLAMMLAVAGTVAKGETVISGAEAARVSFPGFIDTVTRLGGRVSGV
ncbi:MAG: 3-phosphoshikimate 1-carboxyvinyltransferase, partial [Chloroflexota bacterium]